MLVFISYRRSDTQAAARQIADALKRHFGPDSVFLDTRDLAPGAAWRNEVLDWVQRSDVVLVVIGKGWVEAIEDHARDGLRAGTPEDMVQLEVETAFKSGAIVVPVLVDDAEMPARETLQRPFRPVTDVQAYALGHATWERDMAALAAALEPLRPQRPQRAAEPVAPSSAPPDGSIAKRITAHLLGGTTTIVLGSGTNAVDRTAPWREAEGSLPDAAELARHLARRFGLEPEVDDLARASEHVSLAEGRADLYTALRKLVVKPTGDSNSIHRLVAELPRRLRLLRRESYQLVLTTNYDTGVERALDAVHEPYDLVVFAASGEHRGRFMHLPWWDHDRRGARPILMPNEYVELPIDVDGELQRTVVVKLHGGGADLGSGRSQLRDNFVITEDDYIGYLTEGPIESLIPLQILNKIRNSHCLFLGYRLREWSARVFLQRIWVDQRLDARSWAVHPEFELIERRLWDHFGVDVVEAPLAGFTAELAGSLDRLNQPERAP